jgi:hypothetical protein
MSKKPAQHEAHAHENREQLVAERERLRVEQAQSGGDLDTEKSRERINRMGAIDQELAKLDEEGGNGDDKDAG